MRFRLAVPLLFALVASSGAAQDAGKLVTTDWLQAHLNARHVAVVEVGDRATFESGHIPGAHFLALADIAITRNGVASELPEVSALEQTMRAAGIPDRGRIIVYARDIIHATRAFFTFDYLGCDLDVALLDGGYAKWTAENRPVDKGAPEPRKSNFNACAKPDVLVRLAAMQRIVPVAQTNKTVAVVDARPAENYFGTEAGTGIDRPGHIAGAINVPWNENLTSGAVPVFRSRDELAALYSDAGIDEKTPAVVYCRTGMQASVDYFVLRHLGREAYLYDGSYIEWSASKDAQIERAPERK